MMITTQVLDTSRGTAAVRIPVQLDYFVTGEGWREVGHGVTNGDGQITEFGEPPAAGIYRLMFDVASYYPNAFFPSIAVVIDVRDAAGHYHIPLLIGPYGYSAYRG